METNPGPPVDSPNEEGTRPSAAPKSHRRRLGVPLLLLALVVSAAVIAGRLAYISRPEYHFRKGLDALAAGDLSAAAREARRLAAVPEFEAEAHFLAGAALARKNRCEEALAELYQVPESAPFAEKAMTFAAQCNYRLSRFEQAVQSALAAIGHNPDDLDARRWLASAYYDLGATAHAAEQLEIISKSAPGDCAPQRMLGLIEKDRERFPQAVEHYREALRRGCAGAALQDVLRELAQSLVKLSRYEEALSALSEADETAETLTIAAECENGLGRAAEALGTVERALAIGPRHVPALLVKANLQLAAGQIHQSQASLEEALALRPYDQQTHQLLAQVYSRLGDRKKSEEQVTLMKQSQAMAREFSDLHDQAMRNVADAEVRCRLGVLARKLHTAELAGVWFRAALAINPDHAEARAALDEVNRELRNEH